MSIHVRNNSIRKMCVTAVSKGCTSPRKKKVVHFNRLKRAPVVGKVLEPASVKDMGEGAILLVDPVPGNRNGNDLLEDSLEEEMVWMPSTGVTDQASKVTDNVSGQPQAIPAVDKPTIPAADHEVPRPPEEIPPACTSLAVKQANKTTNEIWGPNFPS